MQPVLFLSLSSDRAVLSSKNYRHLPPVNERQDQQRKHLAVLASLGEGLLLAVSSYPRPPAANSRLSKSSTLMARSRPCSKRRNKAASSMLISPRAKAS